MPRTGLAVLSDSKAALSARVAELEAQVEQLRRERDAARLELRRPNFDPPRKEIFPRGQRDESGG